MGIIAYLVCEKCKNAIDLGKSPIALSEIADEFSIPKYNAFEPDWRRVFMYCPSRSFEKVRAFLWKHSKCNIIVMFDHMDLPWESESGWGIVED